MNRQIKFRGKRTDNGEWEYGYLVHDGVIRAEGIHGYRVIPETVGQFTGLTDKFCYTDNMHNNICLQDSNEHCVVIGNIYDNPEL